MQNFTQYTPTEIVFGSKTHLQAGIEVKKWNGHRVLIVYGGGSVVKSGLLETIENALREEKITYEEFGGVKPNPRLAYAERGVHCRDGEAVRRGGFYPGRWWRQFDRHGESNCTWGGESGNKAMGYLDAESATYPVSSDGMCTYDCGSRQ